MQMSILRKHAKLLCTVAAFGVLLGTSACMTFTGESRLVAADRLAGPEQMMARQVAADPFSITVYERVHKKGGPATIYIEGDGLAWVSRHEPSMDPTPDYPVALHLATRDLSDNVIYMARPCQYSKMLDDTKPCPVEYWTSRRFSVEAMQSMNTVLDKLKDRYGFTGYNLVGFSGGGAVATLLAAKRHDILSIRTVGGNLDTALVNENNHVSQMPADTLNPKDFAKDVANIPQHHFVGEWDKVVGENVYNSYRAAMGPSTCTRMSVVGEVDHVDGWVNRWPSLLNEPVDCKAPQ